MQINNINYIIAIIFLLDEYGVGYSVFVYCTNYMHICLSGYNFRSILVALVNDLYMQYITS